MLGHPPEALIALTHALLREEAGIGVPPPGGVKSAMFALLMIEALVWDCKYIRLMYWPS